MNVPINRPKAAVRGGSQYRKVKPVLDDSLLKRALRLVRVLNNALGR